MQCDQSVLILRRGGGSHGGSRVFEPRFDSSTTPNSDLLLPRHHVMNIPEDILKVKQEVDSEFFGAKPSWIQGENYAQSRYSEPDNHNWRNRSAQFSLPTDERSLEAVKERLWRPF